MEVRNLPSETAEPRPIAELIVQNGRMAGTRRQLAEALTLIGQAAGCDIRLNVPGVRSLHCAIVIGREAVYLRDLGGEGVTRVNGEPVVAWTFRTGDILTVGPFQFRVELNQFELDRERDALRVQASAVAAHQGVLTEKEMQLLQREIALEKQERQLAGHFEERRRELDLAQAEVEQGRTDVAVEREGARTDRAAAKEERAAAVAERTRLLKLRSRFKQTWARQWRAKEAEMVGRENGLAAERKAIQDDRAALQRDRASFHETRLRFNGEAELGRRQLEHGWSELGAAQRQWEEGHLREEKDLDFREDALACRAASLAAAEKALLRDKDHWQQTRGTLMRESEGLESRVRHLRTQVLKLQFDRAALRLAAPSEALPPAPVRLSEPRALEGPAAPAVLMRMAQDLTDQRRNLVEQWERMVQAHAAWKEERQALLEEMDACASRLNEREGDLDNQRREVMTGQLALRGYQEGIAEQRARLDSWQSTLAIQESAWKGERARVLMDVARREEAAEALQRQVEDVRLRWVDSRRQEVEELRAARARCAALRRHYSKLWRTCQKQKAMLGRGQRALTTKVLALERWRQELLPRTENSPSAEKRLDRLTEREENLRAEAEAEIGKQSKLLQAESVRLEQRARDLDREESALAGREDELTRRLTEFEMRYSSQEEQDRIRQDELDRLRQSRELDQRQIAELRDEVERIARALLDDRTPDVAEANRAA